MKRLSHTNKSCWDIIQPPLIVLGSPKNIDEPQAMLDTGAKATVPNPLHLLHKPFFHSKKHPSQANMCGATAKDVLITPIAKGLLRMPEIPPHLTGTPCGPRQGMLDGTTNGTKECATAGATLGTNLSANARKSNPEPKLGQTLDTKEDEMSNVGHQGRQNPRFNQRWATWHTTGTAGGFPKGSKEGTPFIVDPLFLKKTNGTVLGASIVRSNGPTMLNMDGVHSHQSNQGGQAQAHQIP